MRLKRKPHPLSGTVSRFISADQQRWLRQKRFQEQQGNDLTADSKTSPKPKRVPESQFVKFMNKLQDRGPQKPETLHEKWTIEIREKMTVEGVWPQGMTDWDIEVLARYLQQLQRQFWNSLHSLLKLNLLPIHCEACGWRIIDPAKLLLQRYRVPPDERNGILEATLDSWRTYNRIYDMIRRKGIRDKLFIMSNGGSLNIRLVRIFIDSYPTDNWIRWHVWHYEHGTIVSRFKGEVVPFLVMPHKYARIEVCTKGPEKEIKNRYEYLQPGENVFVF